MNTEINIMDGVKKEESIGNTPPQETPGHTVSRRSFIKRILGGLAVASLPLAPRKEAQAAPEREPLRDFSVGKFSISGSRIACVFETPDKGNRVAIGDMDASGDILLKEAGNFPFTILDLKISATNPNLIIAVGDKSRRQGQGWIAISRDGGQNWQTEQTGGLTAYGVGITPDNRYAFVAEASPDWENKPAYRCYDLSSAAAGQPARVSSVSQETPASLRTSLSATDQPGVYEGYGTSPSDRGYFKMTFQSDGTVSTIRMHEDVGYPRGELANYTDQGKNYLWSINNDTTAEENSAVPRGTAFILENDILLRGVQPKKCSFSELDAMDIKSALPDVKKGKGYLGVDVEPINQGQVNQNAPRIEEFDLADPGNINRRVLLPENNWPRPLNLELVKLNSLGLIEKDAKRFMVAGISRIQQVPNYSTDMMEYFVNGGGILILDITEGIKPEGVWKKGAVKEKHFSFLPFLSRNWSQGW